MPDPDSPGEILQVDHHANEAVRLRRVMRWSEFQHHLVVIPKVKLLEMLATTQIPHMNTMPKTAIDHICEVQAILEKLRRPPLTSNPDIKAQEPPRRVP